LKQLKAFFQANAFNRNDLFARKKCANHVGLDFLGKKYLNFIRRFFLFKTISQLVIFTNVKEEFFQGRVFSVAFSVIFPFYGKPIFFS
jgi:voltage-gated potassium channel Kch